MNLEFKRKSYKGSPSVEYVAKFKVGIRKCDAVIEQDDDTWFLSFGDLNGADQYIDAGICFRNKSFSKVKAQVPRLLKRFIKAVEKRQTPYEYKIKRLENLKNTYPELKNFKLNLKETDVYLESKGYKIFVTSDKEYTFCYYKGYTVTLSEALKMLRGKMTVDDLYR